MIYSPTGYVCPHRAHTRAAAYTHLSTHLPMNCVVCHPWLWEALATVREDSALLNPLRAHVQNCMTWPSMASIQTRPCCVYIPGRRESERERMQNGQCMKEGWPWLWRKHNLSFEFSLTVTPCLIKIGKKGNRIRHLTQEPEVWVIQKCPNKITHSYIPVKAKPEM